MNSTRFRTHFGIRAYSSVFHQVYYYIKTLTLTRNFHERTRESGIESSPDPHTCCPTPTQMHSRHAWASSKHRANATRPPRRPNAMARSGPRSLCCRTTPPRPVCSATARSRHRRAAQWGTLSPTNASTATRRCTSRASCRQLATSRRWRSGTRTRTLAWFNRSARRSARYHPSAHLTTDGRDST